MYNSSSFKVQRKQNVKKRKQKKTIKANRDESTKESDFHENWGWSYNCVTRPYLNDLRGNPI